MYIRIIVSFCKLVFDLCNTVGKIKKKDQRGKKEKADQSFVPLSHSHIDNDLDSARREDKTN